MKPGYVEVISQVRESELQAFTEHLQAFRAGDTDAQRAAEIRAQDESDGMDSLKRLFDLAHGNSGQCRRVAAFLLGLYNGSRFPFDMTDFRTVDASIFEDMIRVLRMDSRPRAEVHTYFPKGGQAFEALADEWGLHKREWVVGSGGFTTRRGSYQCRIKGANRDGMWEWSVERWEDDQVVASDREWTVDACESAIRQWFDRGGENPHDES